MNSHDHAFPFATEKTMKGHMGTKEGEMGLTIRAYMATKFAAAIVANSHVAKMLSAAKEHLTKDDAAAFDNSIMPRVTARAAVALTDSLIAELSKP